MITVFTPSFADESNTNAQNLTVKEVVARMDPSRFRVVMLGAGRPDPRIAARPNTRLLRWQKRGNTARILWHMLFHTPDVYFFPREGPLDAAFLSARAKLHWKSALVTYVVSGGLEPDADRPILWRAIREGDIVAGNSRHMSETVERLGGRNVQTVFDGIDRRYYYPPEQPQVEGERPAILFAGSFRSYKRADLVIRQAAKNPQWEFRLAGTGEEESACRRLAQDLNCTNVIFLGHLTAAQLGAEMRHASIFLFPSEIEGHPQVLGQAAACGLPCVARSSYHPDYVVDGTTGLLVSSEGEMSEALGRLIREPDLRARMSAAAIQHAEKFDWDRITEQWQQIMERAIVNRKDRAKNFGMQAYDGRGQQNVRTTKTVILTEIIAPYRIPVFNALARRAEVDLHVIFLSETDKVLRQWRIYTDEIGFSYEVLPSWRWRAGKYSLLVNRRLWSALDAANPQTILCGGYNHPASWEALWWARRRNVRFVLWTESNQQDHRSGRGTVEWLKRYFVSSCNAFIVPGKSSLAYLRTLGVNERPIFTAPNAVDNTFFAKQADQVKSQATAFRERFGLPRRFILFVGRLVPEKGVFDLLQAYAKLGSDLRSEVGLVFAGEGVSREALSEQAQLIEPGMICFPGFAQREDLAGLYALAEAFILPTHSDPWGLVVNEAMVCGLPIVVTNVAGCASDLVQDGWNGYVVSPADPDRLSAAISSLLRQPETAQQMRVRSAERIQAYSPQACAHGLAAVVLASGAESR